jgi:uncharacterized protein
VRGEENMMKKIVSLLLAVLMLAGLATVALAASADFGSGRDPWIERVVDNADLLTDSEEQQLSDKISRVMNEYNFDIVVLTENYIGGYTPAEYSQRYYANNDYGCGETYDGVLFLVSMSDRDYYLLTDGLGTDILSKRDVSNIGGSVASYLTAGRYYDAYSKLIDMVEEELYQNKLHPVNKRFLKEGQGMVWLIITIIGVVIALIAVSVMKKNMKTHAIALEANDYIRQGSLRMNNTEETFLYSNVSKTPRVQASSGSGRSDGGFSSGSHHFGGGGGKF